MPLQAVKSFMRWESSGGVVLIAAAILALVAMNSAFHDLYANFIETHFIIGFDGFLLDKSIAHWINDGLMAVFFLVVGLEIKREIVDGELSDGKKASLPVFAAIGGMLFPALFFLFFNWGLSGNIHGWAIPCATDIAFALAVLTLLGKRVPASLKTFLLSVAIIDDLGAILIIALFYSGDLNKIALLAACGLTGVLYLLNRLKVGRVSPYLFVGGVLWVALLKSGIHATLAGVILAFCIPMKAPDGSMPLKDLEESLHPWVVFLIMPLFAFVNAGIPLASVTLDDLFSPLSNGIKSGLILGKPVGIMLLSWIAVRVGLAERPEGASWTSILGMSFLTGIGFTMSLFIGGMAFTQLHQVLQVRLSVLTASTVSALLGYCVLWALGRSRTQT